MNRILEVFIGIVLFPLFVIIGLVFGTIRCYREFNAAFWSIFYEEDSYL